MHGPTPCCHRDDGRSQFEPITVVCSNNSLFSLYNSFTMKLTAIYLLSAYLAVASLNATTLFAQAKGLKGNVHHDLSPNDNNNNNDSPQDTAPVKHFEQATHTLLIGLPKGTILTPEQALFFDSAWIDAYQSYNTDLHVDHVSIRKQQEKQGKHHLRRHQRSLRGWDPSYGRFFDYLVFVQWWCGFTCLDHLWRGRRDLTAKQFRVHKKDQQPLLPDADHTKFERTFCRMLQAGPHEVFHQVTDCHIILHDD